MGPEHLPSPLMYLPPGPRSWDARCTLGPRCRGGMGGAAGGPRYSGRGQSTGRPPSTQTHPSTQRPWGSREETACSRPGSGEAPAAGWGSEPPPFGRPRLPASLTPQPRAQGALAGKVAGVPAPGLRPVCGCSVSRAGRGPLPPLSATHSSLPPSQACLRVRLPRGEMESQGKSPAASQESPHGAPLPPTFPRGSV